MRHESRIPWAVTVATSLTVLVVLGGCAGHDDGDDAPRPTATSVSPSTPTQPPPATATAVVPTATATAAAPTATMAVPTATSVATATRTSTGVLPTATATVESTATSTVPPTSTVPTSTATTEVATPTVSPTHTATEVVPPATATATNTGVVEPPTSTPTSTEAIAPTFTPTLSPTASTTPTEGPPPVLRGVSKSSAVGISSDNAIVVIANPDNNSISIFRTSDNVRVARVSTGAEPSAVAILPNNNEAYVANRGDATVVKVSNLNSANPTVSAAIPVGSEPTGLALSPTGATLYVAEFAEGRISVISGTAMTIIDNIPAPQNPRAVAVTNDGDTDDSDETLIVTEFYGEPNDGADCSAAGGPEACDIGRRGRVRLYNTSDLSPQDPIFFEPIDSGFIAPGGSSAVMTSPNQLNSVAVRNGKIYVTSVSAAPEPPINFRTNVHPVVYVGDLTSHQEDRSNVGSANLARLAEDVIGDAPGTDRLFLEEITDLDFIAGSQAAYGVSRAADALQEVIYDPVDGVRAGTPQINLGANVGAGPCQNPIGIAIDSDTNTAYVNCWVSERLAVVDLDTKTFTTVQSVLPGETTVAPEVRRGRRFYFTGRGRWSDEGEGYSSCGSCHPDGLSDGITWSFGAGPRQTTSMDGSFSHGPGPQKQRIFNWTAIFDEMHDFERNTRGTSGGLGAITTSATAMCGTLAEEQQFAIPADGLGQPIKEIQDDPVNAICTKDWDDIDSFVRTIRPPRSLRWFDPSAAERGAALFVGDGACNKCHAGAGWTVSRRFWEPSSENNTDLKTAPFVAPTADLFWPIHTVQIGAQPAAADDTGANIAPNEVACVLRDVNTFGVPGDDTLTDLIERKADATRTRAQGAGGFNVPSLYGMSVGAPYLHHGQARSLTELFTDPKWGDHLTAGNASFAPTSGQVNDLVNYLLSIDSDTTEQQVPTPFDACPEVFPPNGVFRAELTGDQERPQPVVTDARGEAYLFVSDDERAISFTLNVTGLDPANILQAHIHAAPAGQNGNVVAFIAFTSFEGTIRGTITASDLIPDASMGINTFADLIDAITAGNTYLNVHTTDHPGGEIRGQILPPDFVADLSGGQEVPPVTTTASGAANFFQRRDGMSLAFVVTVDNFPPSQILFSHIHAAATGVNGDVVAFLSATSFTSPLIGAFDAGDVLPSASAGIDDFTDLLAAMNAGNTYVNVHSQTNIGGEIRGQIGPVN